MSRLDTAYVHNLILHTYQSTHMQPREAGMDTMSDTGEYTWYMQLTLETRREGRGLVKGWMIEKVRVISNFGSNLLYDTPSV